MRADLLALTPESVTALANLGLVKRAQREIAAGHGPTIAEDDAGVVSGTFEDGTVARLVPGASLRDTPCSCGAVVVCRHRVATALAYAAWHASRTSGSASSGEPSRAQAWSPAAFDDAALAAHVGKRGMDRARAIVRGGVVVELEPGVTPTARLPTCAVRFLVPNDLAYARCDCAAATACEHVVVAAWAFRAAGPALDAPRAIELHPRAEAATTVDLRPLEAADRLARTVLLEGVTALGAEVAPRFARARDDLAKVGMVWPITIVDDLEIALDAYRARSARYSAAHVAWLLTELEARRRACARGGELPPRFVLGSDEARETLLDHVRLVSLGARVEADGRTRGAEVYLADPGTGMVLVLSKRWTFGEDAEPDTGPELAKRTMAPRVPLGTLARGQLVSRVVKRSANHAVTLGVSRTGQTSLTPQTGDWAMLPPSLLVRDVGAFAAELAKAPPGLLRPRVLASTLRVFAVKEVGPLAYEPGEQRLSAYVRTGNAGDAAPIVRVVRRHHRASPRALDVLAAALADGSRVRFVAGDVRHGFSGLEIDPVAVVTDRVIVPDIEPGDDAAGAVDRCEPVATLVATSAPTPASALEQVSNVLEECCHVGLVRLRKPWADRARAAAERLDEVDLRQPAIRVRALADRARALVEGHGATEAEAGEAVAAWRDAAVRVALARDALAS